MSWPLPHDDEKYRELERDIKGTDWTDVRRPHRKIFLRRNHGERMEQPVHLEAIIDLGNSWTEFVFGCLNLFLELQSESAMQVDKWSIGRTVPFFDRFTLISSMALQLSVELF